MACQWFNLAYGLFSLDTTRSGNLDMIHIYIYIPWTIEHIKLRHRSLFNFKSNLKGVVYLQVVSHVRPGVMIIRGSEKIKSRLKAIKRLHRCRST